MTNNNEKSSPKVKIFVGYAKPFPIFKSEVYQPILTSSVDWNNKALIKDNTEINIAEKNKNYGELTGHYWVWKNFLPQTDSEYIGFCHYRRFLDFNISTNTKISFALTFEQGFKQTFKKYTEENILKCIDGYDIILPHPYLYTKTVYANYIHHHPRKDLDLAFNLLEEKYPEYINAGVKITQALEMYTCMNFIMKKELLDEYFEWIFGFLSELEKITDWSQYTEYNQIRTPAFIAERFFNIWLTKKMEDPNIKVLNTSSLLLIGESYKHTDQNIYIMVVNKEQKERLAIKEEKNSLVTL